MRLQEQIKNDLKSAMKEKNRVKKETIRVIVGEFARMVEKTLSDGRVIRILKKLIKSEKELLKRQGVDADSDFIQIIKGYLPAMATEKEVAAWIRENIDFNRYDNKMQAMREIMAYFDDTVDGNMVKQILTET